MKQVHERKNVLVGGSWSIGKDLWIIQNKQSTSQPSFLKTDGIDSQVSLNYKLWWLMRTLIYIGLFLLIMLVVWWVTKPWREKHNVQITNSQIFLRLLHLLPRYISPYILIRLILRLIKKLKGLWMRNLVFNSYYIFIHIVLLLLGSFRNLISIMQIGRGKSDGIMKNKIGT